jgi:hypothetical protein
LGFLNSDSSVRMSYLFCGLISILLPLWSSASCRGSSLRIKLGE